MKTYKTNELTEILHCGLNRVQQLCNSGEIRAFRAGRSWVITQDALDEYITNQQNNHAQAVVKTRSNQKCQSTLTSLANFVQSSITIIMTGAG